MNGVVRVSNCSVHAMRAHVHPARTNAEKQFPGDGMVTVDRVK
jgi:hypothetical protein